MTTKKQENSSTADARVASFRAVADFCRAQRSARLDSRQCGKHVYVFYTMGLLKKDEECAYRTGP